MPKSRKRYARSLSALHGEAHGTNTRLEYFKVDETITNYIQESLLPIREIAIKAIKNLELEQAKNAIAVMASVVIQYLDARKDYHTDDDPVLYFIQTEFKLIASTSNNELKIRLHPFMVDCWRDIGIKAASTNIKGLPRANNNTNNLVHYPVESLKKLCYANFSEMDSVTPTKTCEALADIGVALMRNCYDHQAAGVIQELEQISRISEKSKIRLFAGSADYAIMRVYVAGLAFRDNAAQDGLNYSFGLINDTIHGLLTDYLQTKRNTFDAMILNPFIGWLLDPFKGLNLSRATEYALFSDDLSEYSLHMNMKSVGWNVENLREAIDLLAKNDDYFFNGQALENLYQTFLLLLSYLNKDMARDHVLYYKKHPYINHELAAKAEEVFFNGLDALISHAADQTRGGSMPGRNYLDILSSIYLIVLCENKKKKHNSLDGLFKNFHEIMKKLINEHVESDNNPNSHLCKHFRLLHAILKNNHFYKLAGDLQVPDPHHNRGGQSFYFESAFPESMIGRGWNITRPTFQVNGFYYNEVEKILGVATD
jgi:hypothetical protein